MQRNVLHVSILKILIKFKFLQKAFLLRFKAFKIFQKALIFKSSQRAFFTNITYPYDLKFHIKNKLVVDHSSPLNRQRMVLDQAHQCQLEIQRYSLILSNAFLRIVLSLKEKKVKLRLI